MVQSPLVAIFNTDTAFCMFFLILFCTKVGLLLHTTAL